MTKLEDCRGSTTHTYGHINTHARASVQVEMKMYMDASMTSLVTNGSCVTMETVTSDIDSGEQLSYKLHDDTAFVQVALYHSPMSTSPWLPIRH